MKCSPKDGVRLLYSLMGVLLINENCLVILFISGGGLFCIWFWNEAPPSVVDPSCQSNRVVKEDAPIAHAGMKGRCALNLRLCGGQLLLPSDLQPHHCFHQHRSFPKLQVLFWYLTSQFLMAAGIAPLWSGFTHETRSDRRGFLLWLSSNTFIFRLWIAAVCVRECVLGIIEVKLKLATGVWSAHSPWAESMWCGYVALCTAVMA